MTTTLRQPIRKTDLTCFEYALEDFLELKASVQAKKAKLLKNFILAQKPNDLMLSAVEGFHLSQQLVLIGAEDPHAFENLICLNPQDGKIQVKSLSGTPTGP